MSAEKSKSKSLDKPSSASQSRSQDKLSDSQQQPPNSRFSQGKDGTKGPPQQTGMKKMFMKIKQKCNLTKRTDISLELMEAYNLTKQYWTALSNVAAGVLQTTQPNREFARNELLAFEAPPCLDEYEQIYGSLEKNRAKGLPFASYNHVDSYAYASWQLALAHREYHRHCAEAMKPVAQFLYEDFVKINEQLKEIYQLRDDYDVKQHDFEKTGVGVQAAKDASDAFVKACSDLDMHMKKAICTEKIIKHGEALEQWFRLHRKYHEKAADELDKVIRLN